MNDSPAPADLSDDALLNKLWNYCGSDNEDVLALVKSFGYTRLAADEVPMRRVVLTHAAGMIDQLADRVKELDKTPLPFADAMVTQLRAKAGEA